MPVVGPFMAPSLRTSEILLPATPSPRSPDHYTSFRVASPPPARSDHRLTTFHIGSPSSKHSDTRYSMHSMASTVPSNKLKTKRPGTASSQMSSFSTSSGSSSSSSSSCSSASQSPEATKAWMKAARKHWNQAILHLDRMLSNWVLFDEETFITLRRSFVTLDCHMKSIIGSTSEPLAKRYCYDAEYLHRTVESYVQSTPEPSSQKADVLIFSALKHLFVNRKTSNEAVRLGIRFAAHIVRSSASETELLAWARFFHNNAVYDETATQLEAAIADLHASNSTAGDSVLSIQDRRRNVKLQTVAEHQCLKSCFED